MQVTYNKRLLMKNTRLIHCKNCGHVHEYFTWGCIPIMFPDHWDSGNAWRTANLVVAPDGLITRKEMPNLPETPMAISKFDIFDVGPRL